MAGLEAQHHQEGPVLVGSDEVCGIVGGDVVHETLAWRLHAIDLDGAVEVLALADKARGGVESGPRTRLSAVVPLSEIARDIARGTEEGGDRNVFLRMGRVVVGDAVDVPILAGDKRRATRGAQRVDHEGVAKSDPLGGDPIEVRRGEPRKASRSALLPLNDAEGVPSLVIREEINEVWRALGGGGRRGVTESRPGSEAESCEQPRGIPAPGMDRVSCDHGLPPAQSICPSIEARWVGHHAATTGSPLKNKNGG